MPQADLKVAILTGGRSSRMGRDKALLPWRSGDLLDHMIATAQRVAGSSGTLIIGDRPEYHGRDAQVVGDLHPDCGPLGGIATALQTTPSRRVLVLAVDMPLVSLQLLNAMCARASSADVLVPEVAGGTEDDSSRARLHVLHAIYSQSCLEPALERLQMNELRVTSLFDALVVERLGESWLRRYDPALRSFENINYPDDYRRIQAKA